MTNFSLSLLISILKQSRKQKNIYCIVPYSFFIFNFLKILKKYGFIFGFNLLIKPISKFKNSRTFIVYLKNNLSFSNYNLTLVSKPGKKIYFSYKHLGKLVMKKSYQFFIISSKNGLFFSNTKKLGGEVICKIN